MSVFLICSSLFIFISCGDGMQQASKFDNNKPIQVIKDAHIFHSEYGKVDVELKSPIIHNYGGDSARTVFPKGLKLWFFNPDLTTKAVLTAKYAINYQKSNKVFVKDSIVIINYNKGDTLYCNELIWEQNLQRVYSNKLVRRVSESGEIWGDGFVANDRFDSIRIKNIRGDRNIKEEEE